MSSDWTRWLACIGVMAAGVAARPIAQPTFRSGVDLVTVDATVLDGDGRPVPTLHAEDFHIEVDGTSRRVVSARFLDQTQPRDAICSISGRPCSFLLPIIHAPPWICSNTGQRCGRLRFR